MKKLLFSFLVVNLFIFSNLQAQENKHMTFKEIPITGKLADFVEKMEKGGFNVVRRDGEMVSMEGQFVNRNCEIYVLATLKSNIVWKVMVFLPEDKTWRSIKSDYFKYKDLFKQKYGSSSLKEFEYFTDPYYEGDGYEIQALSKEKCDYVSFWTLDNGGIILKISKYSQIQFTYEDSINANIAEKERKEEVLNDI